MTNKNFIARQGDVLVESVSAPLPKNLEPIARDQNRVVLAYGEVTGHAHAIKSHRAALFRDPRLAAIFLQVTGNDPVALEHEEHTTIELPPGYYKVTRQKEYSPDAIRTAVD